VPGAEADFARADLCRFLAGCYYQPAPEFAEERLFDSMLAAARAVEAPMAEGVERLGAAFDAQPLQDLLVDYTRLFLGPVEAPARPYGSLWLGGDQELMQQSTMAVVELYREGGFDVAEDFLELPDHVAAELEFLYQLIFREAQARRDSDAAVAEEVSALKRRFLDAHLGRWVTRFAAAIAAHAQSGFYRELAGLTERFVMLEVARSRGAAPLN
jgi:TorA maturation chaperone TorD